VGWAENVASKPRSEDNIKFILKGGGFNCVGIESSGGWATLNWIMNFGSQKGGNLLIPRKPKLYAVSILPLFERGCSSRSKSCQLQV
jgi:hypothetical protein